MQDYEITINFVPDTADPARVFNSMAGLIGAFDRFDNELLDSIDLPLASTILLHDIERGSLKAIFKWILKTPDKEALRDGDWKKVLGRMIDDGRDFLLQKLENEPAIAEKRQLAEIQQGLTQIAAKAPMQLLPHPAPIPLHRVLATLQAFESSTRGLVKGDSAVYTSEQIERIISRDIVISPGLEEELYELIPISQPTRVFLPVKKPDLIGDSQWDLYLQGRVIRAKILDSEWLRKFHNRIVELKCGDALDALLDITLLKTAEGEIVGYRYQVLTVYDVKEKVSYTQLELPEDINEP